MKCVNGAVCAECLDLLKTIQNCKKKFKQLLIMILYTMNQELLKTTSHI